MNEEQVRQIFRDELKNFLTINGYVFDQNLKILDARNIHLGKTNGTKIGTSPDQKLAFFGTTPIVQGGAIAVPSGGGTQDNEARTAIASLITAIKNIGITA